MVDYVTVAKSQFQVRIKKIFKHELVYNILKKDMPKFKIDVTTLDRTVVRALFLLESDANLVAVDAVADVAVAGDGAVVAGGVIVDDNVLLAVTPRAGGVVPLVLATSLLTPRPSIGKKKAKEIKFRSQSSSAKLTKQGRTTTTVQISLSKADEDARRSGALNRLAAAAEAKNQLQNILQQDQLRMQQDQLRMQQEQLRLQQEQMCMQVYLQDPTSDMSRAYFHALG